MEENMSCRVPVAVVFGSLPVSKFPDVTDDQKVWIREERRMQAQTDLFNFLAKEKGKEYAFNWFRDGAAIFWRPRPGCLFSLPGEPSFSIFVGNRATFRGMV
jgi:hypothetical protein